MKTIFALNALNITIGASIIGVCGADCERIGQVKEVSYYNHSVLGKLIQIWVEWDNNLGHLEPYFPREFKNYSDRCGCGVYIK